MANQTFYLFVQQIQINTSDNDKFFHFSLAALNFLLFIYVLIGLAYLINEYLMVSLEKLTFSLNVNENLTGILLALGCSIPEMTTNFLSCFNQSKDMINFGFGNIVGSGVFDFTICFGITSIFSYLYHKKSIDFKMNAILRDFYIYLFSLLYLVMICWDLKVTFSEALVLVLLYPIYLIFCFLMNRGSSQSNKLLEILSLSNEMNETEKIIKIKVPWNIAYRYFLKNPTDVYRNMPLILDLDEDGNSLSENQNILMLNQSDNFPGNEHFLLKKRPEKSPFHRALLIIFGFLKKLSNEILIPWKILFKCSVPLQNFPFISFWIIMIYIYLFTKQLINQLDGFINAFNVSHIFVGLTFSCWAGNISDVFNCSIAAKNHKTELASTSIIGSQIINLQLCLGIPWLVLNIVEGTVHFSGSQLFQSIFVVFLVVILSFSVMVLGRFKLSIGVGLSLIVVYVLYFLFEYYQN